jgi:putative transposase
MRLLDERYLNYPTEGVLQLQDYLRAEGYQINHKRIRRLLRKMGLLAIYPKRNLSKLGKAEYIYPYLLRNLPIDRSNQVWQVDITAGRPRYIPMAKGFMYPGGEPLVAIIDVYSRFVVGWDISNSMNADWVVETLRDAIIRQGKPEIMNSDQGSQFTCKKWVECLQKHLIQISMDGKGRAIDNVYIERLWRTVKYDYVYLSPPENGWQLQKGLAHFFQHYNYHKYHQGIDRQPPTHLLVGVIVILS